VGTRRLEETCSSSHRHVRSRETAYTVRSISLYSADDDSSPAISSLFPRPPPFSALRSTHGKHCLFPWHNWSQYLVLIQVVFIHEQSNFPCRHPWKRVVYEPQLESQAVLRTSTLQHVSHTSRNDDTSSHGHADEMHGCRACTRTTSDLEPREALMALSQRISHS